MTNEAKAAREILIQNGWAHILSSTGNQKTGEYGLLFSRRENGAKVSFWLNNESAKLVLADLV
jgi:hypothetical protein